MIELRLQAKDKIGKELLAFVAGNPVNLKRSDVKRVSGMRVTGESLKYLSDNFAVKPTLPEQMWITGDKARYLVGYLVERYGIDEAIQSEQNCLNCGATAVLSKHKPGSKKILRNSMTGKPIGEIKIFMGENKNDLIDRYKCPKCGHSWRPAKNQTNI